MKVLSKDMTEEQFENGYWYATDLRAFAMSLGVADAGKLRKDQLEAKIIEYLRTGNLGTPKQKRRKGAGSRDVDKGLSMDLPIENYSSNEETKAFIQREASKLVPNFKRKPGTRYLLNRWREEQLENGNPITYGDLVRQAIALNESKKGPLRMAHGRYMNFISDFMAENKGASQEQAVAAWNEVKEIDAPKTYAAWAKHCRGKSKPRRTKQS